MTTIKATGRDLELKGDQDIVFYPTQNIWVSQGTKLIFEGTVPDDHEAKLQATAVTADRDIILPDASGTITLNEKLTDGTFDMNVNSLTVTGAGSTSVIQAAQDIDLDATGAVIVKDTPLRLASLTTTQRNALTPTNGDMIYNTTTNQFEIYRNGAWETNATTESLVDSAPSTLDTLNELAAALGDDPNFATTTANNIATKWTQDNTKISNWDTSYTYSQVGHVPLSGGTMAGLLTLSGAPTANLHAATKQYVDSEITANAGGGVMNLANPVPAGNYLAFHADPPNASWQVFKGGNANNVVASAGNFVHVAGPFTLTQTETLGLYTFGSNGTGGIIILSVGN